MKTYSTTSTARRAAKTFAEKTQLVNLADLQLTGDKNSGYGVCFICRNEEATIAVKEAGFLAESLYPEPMEIDDPALAAEAEQEEAARIDAIKRTRYIRETSNHSGVCAEVWAVADEMAAEAADKGEKLSRKDVIEACRARGVAFGTARTQYQKWFTARR